MQKRKRQFTFVWNENSERRPYVRKLFKSWHETLQNYESAWRDIGDLPYVYDERPQVGLLAIAAKEIHWLPFIEFCIDRRGNNSRRGYCDLSIWRPRQYAEIWVEAAKIALTWDSRYEKLRDKVSYPFRHVREGIKSATGRAIGLAVVFVSFYGSPIDDFEQSKFDIQVRAVKRNLYKVTRGVRADFYALHLCAPEIVAKSAHKDCPGIAVVGKLYKSP